MSFNKKILAVAVVAAMASPAAMAAVTLNSTPADAVEYPEEIIIPQPAGSLVLVNGGSNLDITSALNYAFTAGETRYVRVACLNNMKFNANTGVTMSDPNLVPSGVNGLGTSSISFSVTATAAGTGSFTLSGDRTIVNTGDVNCNYSLYDTPAQAAAGGDTGRITGTADLYIDFIDSYEQITTAANATADVESTSGAYTQFSGPTAGTYVNTVSIGTITTRLNPAPPVIFEADGTNLTFAEIIGTGSRHIVNGDFTFAANDDGTYTGAALARVQLDTDGNCADVTNRVNATSVSGSQAVFATGNVALTGVAVCITSEGTPSIGEGGFNVTWDVVSAAPTMYTAQDETDNLGSITRNGTQIQAPLVQGPAGYLSRIALSNTGGQARSYSVRVINVDGSTATVNPAQATGTVGANSTKMINVSGTNGIISSFTGAERATVIITVAAPNNQIQGLYQIVKPDVGSIDNTVMVRPGTN